MCLCHLIPCWHHGLLSDLRYRQANWLREVTQGDSAAGDTAKMTAYVHLGFIPLYSGFCQPGDSQSVTTSTHSCHFLTKAPLEKPAGSQVE